MDELTKANLKAQALLEKVASMTAQYENQIADLRVELTLTGQRLAAMTDDAPVDAELVDND